MITGINELKTLTQHISWELDVNLTEENVSLINGGIIINVDVKAKYVMYVKRLCLESCYTQM